MLWQRPIISLISLAVSWRDFSCVDRKVRYSAARKLNRGRKRKQWGKGRGEKVVKITLTAPPPLFSVLTSV